MSAALIKTFPRPGGFFSSSLPQNLDHIMRWGLIAAPDAVWSGDNRLQTTGRDCTLGLVVNCLGVFVSPGSGRAIEWRPLESRLYFAADRLGAWQLVNGKPRQETLPWGTIRFFDLSNTEFQHVFAHELAATSRQHGCRFIFLDEPRIEDAVFLKFILRFYAMLVGGNPLPIITNGTFGGEGSPVLVKGRYWQDLPNHYPEIAARETREDQIGLIHTTPSRGCTPEFSACLASIMGGCYQHTPTNWFSYDYIPEPFEQGFFGAPVGDRFQLGDIYRRSFERAEVAVNVSRDREATIGGVTIPPLGHMVRWINAIPATLSTEAARG